MPKQSKRLFAKPLVVGVDGSPASLHAAALAWRLARTAKTKCYLVHAVPEARLPPAIASAPAYAAYLPGFVRQTLAQARQNIVARLSDVVPRPAMRALDVRAGRAAAVVADAAARRGAGLVVLGGKRRGVVVRALTGDTARYLVRTLDVPVLVVAGTSRRLRRVLVAADLSDAAAPTLATGAALARLLGARLRLLHVVEPIRYPRVVPRAPDRKVFLRESTELFERLAAGARTAARSEVIIREGAAAADAIAREAKRWQADVVVVGSHGKGWVARLLIGSTTEWLLRKLPTSLLIVPTAGGRRGASPRASG